MGYDTTAYREPPGPGIVREGNEIAYMRGRNGIFEALDVLEFDGKVSGNAGSRWFTRSELQVGLNRLLAQETEPSSITSAYGRGIMFLRECIASLPTDEDRLWIWFC